MDEKILFVLVILFAAAALSATFWRAVRSTQMKKKRDDRRSAKRHRKITRQYREEQDRLGK